MQFRFNVEVDDEKLAAAIAQGLKLAQPTPTPAPAPPAPTPPAPPPPAPAPAPSPPVPSPSPQPAPVPGTAITPAYPGLINWVDAKHPFDKTIAGTVHDGRYKVDLQEDIHDMPAPISAHMKDPAYQFRNLTRSNRGVIDPATGPRLLRFPDAAEGAAFLARIDKETGGKLGSASVSSDAGSFIYFRLENPVYWVDQDTTRSEIGCYGDALKYQQPYKRIWSIEGLNGLFADTEGCAVGDWHYGDGVTPGNQQPINWRHDGGGKLVLALTRGARPGANPGNDRWGGQVMEDVAAIQLTRGEHLFVYEEAYISNDGDGFIRVAAQFGRRSPIELFKRKGPLGAPNTYFPKTGLYKWWVPIKSRTDSISRGQIVIAENIEPRKGLDAGDAIAAFIKATA